MAPIPQSSYFPSLDKCISGEELLLSWKSAFSAVTSDLELGNDHKAVIEAFLGDPEVLEYLANPFDAYHEPSAQTKNTFETKTSAINVTPSASARYDVKEIKEDALWLSKAAKIDEVSALRVVVEECQSRASAQLLGPFSEEELVSIREAAGNIKYSSPIPVSLLSQGAEPHMIQKEFDTQDNRRHRIIRTYLSERRHLLKCSERIFHAFFFNIDAQEENGRGKKLAVAPSWLEESGKALALKLKSSNGDEFLLRCIAALGTNIKNLESGSGFSTEGSGREDVEIEWVRNQIIEATHTMELIWQFLIYVVEFPSSKIVLEWFRLQQTCGFFNSFDIEEPSIQTLFLPMQSISTVVSVAMLGSSTCLEWLNNPQIEDEVSSSLLSSQPYILNTETVAEIHTIVFDAADIGFTTAGPLILAWSVILQTMTERVMGQEISGESSRFDRGSSVDTDVTLAPDRYKDVLEQINDSLEEDVIDFLARRAVNFCHVFETLSGLSLRLGNTSNALFPHAIAAQMRMIILDLIKGSTRIGYIPEIIEATLSTLTGGQSYWDVLYSKPIRKVDDPIQKFLEDDVLVHAFLQNAQSRYPYEPLPFLKMIRAVAASSSCHGDETSKSALTVLDSLSIFTYALPPDFADYETTQEEDNNNNIRLTQPVRLFIPRSKSIRNQVEHARSLALMRVDEDFYIPAGTPGRIISESGPRVAFWFHEYSGLKYFGKLLETFPAASDLVDATTGMPVDRDSVSEIIGILATLLLSIAQSPKEGFDPKEAALKVLQVASSGLSRNRDITTVIFDIFEEELQNQSTISGPDVPLEILVSCVSFIHALLPIAPGRVWPLLSRSGLLGVGRGGGRLPSIVESVELLSARYDLLIASCHLYESLVDDFVTHAIKRKNRTKSPVRHQDKEDVGTGIPEHVLSKILLSFTRYMVEFLESSCNWKFVAQDDRRYISKIIGTAFNKILRYAYGIESSLPNTTDSVIKDGLKERAKPVEQKEKSTKIMEALMPAASHIVDSFLSTSSGTLRFQPLLRSYFDGVETPDSTVFLNMLNLWTGQVNTILAFSKTLLRVSSMLERPASQLESQIFKASSLIARLYAANDTYRNNVVVLFESLIVAASTNTSEPPSLLGHLGPHTARNFLHILSDLDKPLSREDNLIAIWHFLSMIVSSRQQWFANYLLTGKTPRDALNSNTAKEELATLDKPLLTTALDALSNIKHLPKIESLSILEFVAMAQNFWPWTVCDSPKYVDFIRSISDFAGNLKPIQSSQQSSSVEEAIHDCYQTRIAAYIAEILAMHLFHSRQTGAASPLKGLLDNLSYFARFAVAVPSYRGPLHSKLKQNFEQKYPGCTPLDLKRTTLEPRQFGTEYFYDVALADRMLRDERFWFGVGDNEGNRLNFELANINLSLVDAQIALFHSWKFLSIELSGNVSAEPKLQNMLGTVVIDCLVANGRSQPPEDIFSKLSQTRADFALVIAQRLIQARSSVPEVKGLLTTVWATICTLRGSFERPVPDGDILYYRSLLKLLFLAVRVHAEAETPTPNENFKASLRITQSAAIIPTILDIVKHVVSMGLRELASTIHDSPADSSPEDLALITGILQSCLRIPGIELCHSQIISIMASNSSPLLAIKLFSWSERIAIDGDPIYGELSILFLLELSSMPLMAEQLAIGGLLSQIFSADITTYFRRPGVSPFAESAGLQRCYSIWARGILPLLLNLLDAVQSSIAIEVAQFLNQFPTLLTQSEQAFDAPETNRIMPKGRTKYITLTVCSEVHSMSLLTYILNGFRETLSGTLEIPEVKWDAAGVMENVEFWLGSKALLRERILPMGNREVEMVRKKIAAGNAVSRLEEKVIAELEGIRDVLSRGDN